MARVPVWLYLPNLIGYVRIILSGLAFASAKTPSSFAVYYSISFMLDGLDGLAARVMRQSSEFGALLDMLTDRCATAALLVTIAAITTRAPPGSLPLPPSATAAVPPAALALAFLDGYSHWLQFAAGLVSSAESHKTAGRGRVLELYYWRPVLTFVCTLNEFCFIALYMLVAPSATPHTPLPAFLSPLAQFAPTLAHLVFLVSAPVCLFKQGISVRQIFSATYTIRDEYAAAYKAQAAIADNPGKTAHRMTTRSAAAAASSADSPSASSSVA
jgi:CDP-diacylglycerol--inositol 3-phosphatidyltransferase